MILTLNIFSCSLKLVYRLLSLQIQDKYDRQTKKNSALLSFMTHSKQMYLCVAVKDRVTR